MNDAMETECSREQGRLFIFPFCCLAIRIRDRWYLKENPSEDANWSEKVAQVQRLPSAMVTIPFVKSRCWKVTETQLVSAAILCPAVYISDVINEDVMCGESIKLRHKPTFLCSSPVKSEATRLRPEEEEESIFV